MTIRERIASLLGDQLHDQLREAMPQGFPGRLTLHCACTQVDQVDGALTGEDLVAVVEWLNRHSRHGERSILLEVPAGTDTKVDLNI